MSGNLRGFVSAEKRGGKEDEENLYKAFFVLLLLHKKEVGFCLSTCRS
jgi:hypothetical protein